MTKVERKGMSKKAARAAAEKEAAAKKSKPAKANAAKTPKPAKGKKQSSPKTVKQKSTALVPAPVVDLSALNQAANQNESRLREIIPEHVARGEEIYNIMQDHQDRQLWKFGDTPYKSWSAFIEHYAEIAKISKRTLQAVVSSNKALPGVSAGVKKKIGPRKLKKVVAAVKKHRERTGNPKAEPPAAIIDAAVSQPEAEFDRTLKEHDLSPEREQSENFSRDMFEHGRVEETAEGFSVDRSPGKPIDTPEGYFRAHPQPADEAPEVVQRAVAAAVKLYDAESPLEFICARFLKEQYDGAEERFHDTTNDAAYAELFPASGNGKKRRKK